MHQTHKENKLHIIKHPQITEAIWNKFDNSNHTVIFSLKETLHSPTLHMFINHIYTHIETIIHEIEI